MQRQAYATEELWMEVTKVANGKYIMKILENIWNSNYSNSLDEMQKAIIHFDDTTGSNYFINKITEIALDICKTRVDSAASINKQSPDLETYYKKGNELVKKEKYENGFKYLKKAFTECTILMQGQKLEQPDKDKAEQKDKTLLYFYIILIIFAIILLLFVLNKKH